MKFHILVSLLFFLLCAPTSIAQSLGGCARGTEMGFVTVTEVVPLTYYRGGDRAGIVEPGDELRLCRYDREAAVVTVWARGIGYRIPRSAIGQPRSRPTLRSITQQDLACLGPRIDAIQMEHGDDQDWALLDLARRTGLSLEMVNLIRLEAGERTFRGQTLPPCEEATGHFQTGESVIDPEGRRTTSSRALPVYFGRGESSATLSDTLVGLVIHDYVLEARNNQTMTIVLVSRGPITVSVLDNAQYDRGRYEALEPRQLRQVMDQNNEALGWAWVGTLPRTTTWRVRVRHDLRQTDSLQESTYTLTVGIE